MTPRLPGRPAWIALAGVVALGMAFCANAQTKGCRDKQTGVCCPGNWPCPASVASCYTDPSVPCSAPPPTPGPTATPVPTPRPTPPPSTTPCIPPQVQYPVQIIDCGTLAWGARGEVLCSGHWLVVRDGNGKLYPIASAIPNL